MTDTRNANVAEREEWRVIPGYDDYEVSNLGRVRARSRLRAHRRGGLRKIPGRIMRGTTIKYGYRFVALRWKTNSPRRIAVHRLVLAAFVGPRPVGMESCHADGNAANNRLDNLRYDTKAANIEDRNRHGRLPKGDGHPNAKLTASAVRKIRSDNASGIQQKTLAAAHSVSTSLINSIISRKIWRHV
jgi:hypothetical protein